MNHNLMRRLVIVFLLLLLVVCFSITSPYFLTTDNISAIFREASSVGIIALGMTFVIITAGIDLSVGAIVAFVAMTCVNMLQYTSLPVPVIIVVALAVGGLIGMLNGWIIVTFKMPDFIVTLATMGILRGLTLLISIREDGFIRNVVINNEDYTSLADRIGPIYYVTIAFIIMAILLHVVLKRTQFGIYIYATGADIKSAKLSGINTDKMKMLAYIISGMTCAITAVFISSRMMTATPDLGIGLDLDVIAAVVVGGTAFSGGKGDIIGTFIGAIFMVVVQNGIYKFHISASYQPIIMGTILIMSIVFDEWYKKYSQDKMSREVSPTGNIS